MHLQTVTEADHWIIYDADSGLQPIKSWFKPQHWQQQGAITGQSKGRNVTWFFELQHQQFVLRHYYRGGLVGKLIDDKFLGVNYQASRPVKEMTLLARLAELQLPAPVPLGVLIEKAGFCSYRADLIMQRIEGAQDVFQILKERELSPAQWQLIGRTIALFHQQGVYHDDLNIHNILLDDSNKCWLIDFDKGQIKTPNPDWQQGNLQRLLRSLRKELGLNAHFSWQESHWDSLMIGYQQVNPHG